MKEIKDIINVIPSFQAKTDPFGENVSAEHAYKRTEKIVSALYLVTNHVHDKEPLKNNIRSLGHNLISDVMALRSGFRSISHEKRSKILSSIREIISFVYLLQTSGYVSENNVAILVHALDDLGIFVAGAQYSSLSEGVQLKREDFIPSKSNLSYSNSSAIATKNSIGSNSDEKFVSKKSKTTISTKKVYKTPGRSVQTDTHNERHNLLKDILMNNGPLGIKDIASQMIGCSEKTVQRELAVLIKQGYVKKSGEKRWSTYEIK